MILDPYEIYTLMMQLRSVQRSDDTLRETKPTLYKVVSHLLQGIGLHHQGKTSP